MLRVWRTPSHRNLTKLRSLHPVSEFTSPSSMRISTCRAFWTAFLDPRAGWHPDSVKLVDNPEAEPRERLPKPMAGSAGDPGKQFEARAGTPRWQAAVGFADQGPHVWCQH